MEITLALLVLHFLLFIENTILPFNNSNSTILFPIHFLNTLTGLSIITPFLNFSFSSKLALDKLALDKLALDKLALDKSASDKLARLKSALDKTALYKLALNKLALDKLALYKLALYK